MAFQARNETCEMKPKHSGRNLAKKSGTDRDLKWGQNYSIFWIGMKCFGHSGRNVTELTTLDKMACWPNKHFLFPIIYILSFLSALLYYSIL